MALARGDLDPDSELMPVFDATAAAILGYNDGQGGLALEEIANIGEAVLNFGLVSTENAEAELGGRSIREVVVGLLEELAERRANGTAGVGGPAYTDADIRRQALNIAVDRVRRCGNNGLAEPIVDASQVFYDFIAKAPAEPWIRVSALQQASEITEPQNRASTVVLVAEDFMLFLEPPQQEAPAEEPQVETIN
jgi:hypothetical protein